MRYVDASAVLRIVFAEDGPTVPLNADGGIVSSALNAVDAFRAIDRARLVGNLDDVTTATKRKELTDLLAMIDLAPIEEQIISRARGSFPVPVRALDAIHVATAEVLSTAAGEPVEFWTHDERQAVAALSRGIAVLGVELPG